MTAKESLFKQNAKPGIRLMIEISKLKKGNETLPKEPAKKYKKENSPNIVQNEIGAAF